MGNRSNNTQPGDISGAKTKKENLIIVSNRLPVTIEKRDGAFHYQRSVGGLATGLGSVYQLFNSHWLGWCGINAENVNSDQRKTIAERLKKDYRCYPIFLRRRDVRLYYYGFSNKTLWPLFHYFNQHIDFDVNFWHAYQRVNRAFCDAVVDIARPNDIIWVHDYQLMLLPGMLREKLPEARIGFFLHIPFPTFEIFRMLPWRNEILEGLLGSDLIGFHSNDYTRYFLLSVRRLTGHDHELGIISYNGRQIKAETLPMGINYQRFHDAVNSDSVSKEVKRIRKQVGNNRLVLSIDRLDYTKGIVERLEAFDHFLASNRSYRQKINLILVAVPSRTGVESYIQLKKRIDELIGRINGTYGTLNWVPVTYIYRALPFPKLVALYNTADVALVTPLRDGMNLIAKEYLACRTDHTGVLILSEMAGAAKDLGEAIIINPNNRHQVAEALKTALQMPRDEQVAGNTIMQKRLQTYNAERWAVDFLRQLSGSQPRETSDSVHEVTPATVKTIRSAFSKAGQRLFLLDYDGTLIGHRDRPWLAKPASTQTRLLDALSRLPGCRVVIISGRDRKTLEQWFGGLDIALVAEHGVWLKEKDKAWSLIEPMDNEWKEAVRPILEEFDHRTPGALIEDKEYSLVFHYRRVDSDLAAMRVRELKDTLIHFTANLDLGVEQGKNIIEVKKLGVNKGRAAAHWLNKQAWDFVLAAGDDLTDENLFRALPDSAFSIKISGGDSAARYCLKTAAEFRELLQAIMS